MNLFLHITGRREDGYHLLQTVFQLLDYGDELTFAKRDDGQLSLSVVPQEVLPVNDDNLVFRAAKLLVQLAKRDGKTIPGADITLYKRLPAGAGLGGGSSDAATTLVALNYLWQLDCSVDELAALGLQLGADVPVFVRAQSAWAEGVGEKLQPIAMPARWFVVLTPQVHVATAELFACPELTRDCAPITIRGFRSGSRTQNVFEPLVCRFQPEVKLALDELSIEAKRFDYKAPRMTGTGSSVFLECESRTGAQKVLDAVLGRARSLQGFIARGVEHSELLHYT